MAIEPENNGCYTDGSFNQPSTNTTTPPDNGSNNGSIENGNGSGGVPTDNTNNTNNSTHTEEDNGPPIFNPLLTQGILSSSKKKVNMKATNYPADQPDKLIFYDYTILSPSITYRYQRQINMSDKLYFTFLIKFYRDSNLMTDANVIFSEKRIFYVKPQPILTFFSDKLLLNYYIPHISPVANYKIKAMSVELIEVDSDFFIEFTAIDVIGKMIAVTRF